MRAQHSISPNANSTITQSVIARHRKVASVRTESFGRSYGLIMGLGTSCQETFCTSFQVIRDTNANHQIPLGDDKPQPLG